MATFSSLSEDLVAHVTSFVLHYTVVDPELAVNHGGVALACKLLRRAADNNVHRYIRDITSSRWARAPRNLLNALYTDALRLRINGVTQRMALALRVPRPEIDNLDYDLVHIAQVYNANVYSWEDIFRVLSSLYQHYQTPAGARSNARPRKRGLYLQEQARKKRRLEMDEKRKQSVERRRAKLEAHPEWHVVRAAYDATRREDIFGDFLERKVRTDTKMADVIHAARRISTLLQVLHPSDVPQDLDQEPTAVVRICVQRVVDTLVGACVKGKTMCTTWPEHCDYGRCTKTAASTCPFHLCGKHCHGCIRHTRW